jgi:hypothetical protein
MDTQKLAAMVLPAAPALASALTGAGSSLALAALGKALLDDDQASPDEIATAIGQATPDTPLKIKAAQENFLGELTDAGVSLAQINAGEEAKRLDVYAQLDASAAADRQDARQRQVKTNDQTNSILAYMVTAGFFIVLFLLIFLPSITQLTPGLANTTGGTGAAGATSGAAIEPGMKAVLQTLLGVLGTAWVSVISYYFGSSIGSKEKNSLLEEDVVASNKPAKSQAT